MKNNFIRFFAFVALMAFSVSAAFAYSPYSPAAGGGAYTTTVNTGAQDLKRVAQLPNWNKALSRVVKGQGNARVLFIGDSVTQGYNSTGASGNQQGSSFASQFGAILNAAGILARTDTFMGGGASDRSSTTPVITLGSGWGYTCVVHVIGGCIPFEQTASGALAYTPTSNVDTFEFWTLGNSGFGNGVLDWKIDAGSTTGIDNNAADNFTRNVATTTLGAHTLNFTSADSNYTFVIGAGGYDSSKSQVMIYNAGWSGSGTNDWIESGSTWSPVTACGTFNADLVVINLQINDERAALSLATFNTRLNSIITGCQSGGSTDVVLMTSNHINPSDASSPTSEATQATYAAQLRTTAAANSNSAAVSGLPVIDGFAELVSYNNQVALGAVYLPGTDISDLHPNNVGHLILGRITAAALLPSGLGGFPDTPNPLSVYSAGTAYSLTATPAALDFGTTDPTITLNARGRYRIVARARLDYNAATFAAVRTATLKLRRTNNTAADLTSGTVTSKTQIVTTLNGTFLDQTWVVNSYTTRNITDIITIFGSLDVVPSAGSLDVVEASITAERLSQ